MFIVHVATVAIPGAKYPPGGIFVTGGYDGGKAQRTTEIIYANQTVKQGKSLPEVRAAHCMVEYQGKEL